MYQRSLLHASYSHSLTCNHFYELALKRVIWSSGTCTVSTVTNLAPTGETKKVLKALSWSGNICGKANRFQTAGQRHIIGTYRRQEISAQYKNSRWQFHRRSEENLFKVGISGKKVVVNSMVNENQRNCRCWKCETNGNNKNLFSPISLSTFLFSPFSCTSAFHFR